MAAVAPNVQHESSQRLRFAALAFAAAVLIVASALVQLSITEPNSELTTVLEIYSRKGGTNLIGSVLECLGYIMLAVALFWLHRCAQARRPESSAVVRLAVAVGAVLAGLIAVADTVAIANVAHTFVTTGDQGYPEAHHLAANSTALNLLPILGFLGTAVLAIGVLLTSLTSMRVGLLTKGVGYIGVFAGILFFLSGFGFLGLVIQAFWLAALAVTISGRWPSGDPPAWQAGVAVPWPSRVPAQPPAGSRAAARNGRRGRVSDKEVLAAVEQSKREPPPNTGAGRAKRKRKRN